MNDGRLQIIWIEDQAERFAIKLTTLDKDDAKCFQVRAVGELEELLTFRSGGAGGLEYPQFDIAVCDFNLVSSEFEVEGVEEAGLKAQAAGLMIGVLLALREPGRPRGIVPYSGSPEQFGENWRLLKSYLPEAVVLSEEFEASKLARGAVFAAAASAFRESIVRLAADARLHFRDETVHWLLAVADDPVKLDDQHRNLEIIYSGGTRSIATAALFYSEHIRDSVAGGNAHVAAAVKNFVQQLNLTSEDTRAGRQLADTYWRTSTSPASLAAYGVPVEGIGGAGRETARWLTTESGFGEWSKAFAAIDLCIRAYVEQVSVIEALDLVWWELDDASSVDITEVQALVLDFVDAPEGSFFAGCLAALIDDLREDAVFDFETLKDRVSGMQASRNPVELWEERWVRAVDPMPKSGQAVRNVGPRERIGTGLSRYLTERLDAPVQPGAAKGIIQGAALLPPELMTMARRLAFEMIPPRLTWPSFLARAGRTL